MDGFGVVGRSVGEIALMARAADVCGDDPQLGPPPGTVAPLPPAPPIDPNIQYALAYLLQALGKTDTDSVQNLYPIGVPERAKATVLADDSAQPSGVAEPKIRKRSRKRRLPKTLSRDEMERLFKTPNLRSASGLRDRCILELLYRAGLRVGEVVALEPRDVDTSRGMIRILDGKGGDGTAYFDPAGVALDGQTIAGLLDRWKDRRRDLKLKSPYLFCTIRAGHSKLGRDYEAGAPVSTRQIQAMIKRRARKAGLDPRKVTPHVLRHTFATELLDEGFHIREVQEAMRHANIQTTEVYLHVVDSNLRRKIGDRERGKRPSE